jgi:DNA-binding IclR family transcriptional regulator
MSNTSEFDNHRQLPSRDGCVDRFTRVLDCFFSTEGPLPLSAVARTVGLPKSTTHRLLAALVSQDLIRRSGKEYTLGDQWRRWADDTQMRYHWMSRTAIPYMSELFAKQQLITSLAVLTGDMSVTSIAMLHSRSHIPIMARTGNLVLPAEQTVSGRVLLAFDTVSASRYLNNSRESRSGEPDSLDVELSAIRRAGIAFGPVRNSPSSAACAAPVFGRRRSHLAALAVAGSAEEFSPASAERAVRNMAYAISRALRTSSVNPR